MACLADSVLGTGNTYAHNPTPIALCQSYKYSANLKSVSVYDYFGFFYAIAMLIESSISKLLNLVLDFEVV